MCLILAIPHTGLAEIQAGCVGGDTIPRFRLVLITCPLLGRPPHFLLPREALALPSERKKPPVQHRVAFCALLSLGRAGRVWVIPRSSIHWGYVEGQCCCFALWAADPACSVKKVGCHGLHCFPQTEGEPGNDLQAMCSSCLAPGAPEPRWDRHDFCDTD